MPATTIQNSFSAGEMSPSLFGRTDLVKYHNGASTMRNFFANYRGGASSRAGLAYVGACKQPGTAAPPRDITFQFSILQGYALEFGDQYMRIKSNGAYVTEQNNAITGITKANPGVFSYTNTHYTLSDGDWVFISGVTGMTNFNGLTWIVTNATSNSFKVTDLFGNPVNTTLFNTYVSGGTLARIYTVVAPYAAVDLPYLKYTQSADTMTLTCVNQQTNFEYPSYELVRAGATNWTFTADSFASVIAAPTGIAVTAQSSTTVSTWYGYVVTAIDADTGEESVASAPGTVENNDIAVNAGSNIITWNAVANASSYNVYKATPSYAVTVPTGAQFGYVGTAFGGAFTDTNITADFTHVPPTHNDPFARGAVAAVNPTAGGSSYTQATIGYTVTTATGTGFSGSPVVVGGKFVAFIINNSGQGYALSDTIAITTSSTGSGATATFVVGEESGTYPGACAYYQQRRVYANTLNHPDTYYMSQPGAFNNMDSSIPVTDSDAIVGSPWAQQINGVQFMVPMPGGLVVLTGKGAWQVNGGNNSAITPADQDAMPQAYNGCNDIVAPLVVNFDILYLQSKGSIFRDLSYNFFANIYTGTDLTVLSNQLFDNYTFSQWCWAEEPYKLAWAVRDDGTLLSLTYLKEQDVYAWARHDTNGLVVGVTSVTEPPVDAVYCIVKRYVQGGWRYYSERMNNRTWKNVEDSFCVDAGLSYPMGTPNATLTPGLPVYTDAIYTVNLLNGGSGYTSPTVIVDDVSGSGATFSVTLVSGVITAITPLTFGNGYTAPKLTISDPTGSGASANAAPQTIYNLNSSAFSTVGSAGDIVRVGGGVLEIISVSGMTALAQATQPITLTVPNDPDNRPVPANAGDWTITTPTLTVNGLNHLEGLTVAILADGGVVTNQVVANGAITLQQAATAITVGLPFICQLQSMYLDPAGQTTAQSRRKLISSVAVRVEATRGLTVGSNQPDASVQPNNANVPWTGMVPIKQRNALVNAGQAIPLYTGDEYVNIGGGWTTPGQVACQQTYPLPANVLAFIYYYVLGDTDG